MISVIICTYNRCELLSDCLMSVVNQYSKDSVIEIIVVDNNCTDDTKKTVNQFSTEYSFIRLVEETKQGLSFARNKGYQQAKYEWVAYLDDDGIARPNWLVRACFVINNYNFDAFGGRYYPWYREGKVDWYLDEYGSNLFVEIDKVSAIPNNVFFSGGNCFFKKQVLVKFGGFPVNLGMQGNSIAYGEETKLQSILHKNNYSLGFDPELIIDHYVPHSKQCISWFFKRYYSLGRDYWLSFDIKPSVIDILKLIFIALFAPVLLMPKALFLWCKGKYHFQNVIISAFIPSARSIGKILSIIH